MKFSQIFHVLVPKDKQFIPLFEKDAENLVVGVAVFKELISACMIELETEEDYNKIQEIVKRIKEIEHIGDDITHQIFKELNQTFITPFDREDIHELAASIDDVLDCLNSASQKIRLYKPRRLNESFMKFAGLIEQAAGHIQAAVNNLKDLKHAEVIKRACYEINTIENLGDDVYHEAISELFKTEKDAIELIKTIIVKAA